MAQSETAEKHTEKPLEKHTSKHSSNGFLSSFFSAAHNVANMVMSDEEESKAQARTGLPSSKTNSRLLQVPGHDAERLSNHTSGTSMHSNTTPDPSLGQSHGNETGSFAEKFPALPRLATSNVHFEPVHDSPLNTMGNGDLQLLHFDGKSTDQTHAVPAVPLQGENENGEELLSVLGGDDSRVVKRQRRSSEISSNDSLEDELSVAETEETNLELDKLLESSDISFASSKKNKEFHQAFKKIPLSERLISDYSCALSKEILVQGKMYLSQNFICFSSNILGWVTHLVIPLQEVIQIEKKSTAVLFPNGLIIRTLHQKYVFATFISRDSTFAQITRVWHDVLLGKGAHKANGRARSQSRVSNRNSYDSYTSSGDESNDDEGEDTDRETRSSNASNDNEEEEATTNRKSSEERRGDKDTDDGNEDAEDGGEGDSGLAKEGGSGGGGDFKGIANPGPAKHEPTKPDREDESNDVSILDHTFKAPPGVIFSILFGPDTSHYIKVLEDQKNFDIEKNNITELSNKLKERKYVYTKPLSGPIGPKQTKCHITDRLVHCDYSKYIHVEQISQTPDVPLGNSFKIVTTILFSWAENNGTNMHVVTNIEWSGKSWIKGAIEKGSIDGQKESMKSLTDTVTDIIELGLGGTKKKRQRSKSSRRLTHNEQDSKPAPPKELTLSEQIVQLAETVGKAVPISVPMVSDAMVGAIVIFLGSLIYTWLLTRLFGGNSHSAPHVSDAAGSARLLKFGNNNFYIMPSQDKYINDKQGRMVKEARIWSWINLRSLGKIPNLSKSSGGSQYSDQYASQEFEEIVKLTKQRVDELYHRISD